MRATPATTGRQSTPQLAATAVSRAEYAPYVDLGARVEWADAGWSTPLHEGPVSPRPAAEARTPQDRVRLAHRATSSRPSII